MKSKINIPVGVALFAVLALGLIFLLPGGLAQAQQAQQSFTYAENGTGPVANFAARDPEGVTPIVWSLLTDHAGVQDLGIFTDIIINENGNAGNDGIDDAEDDVEAVDIAGFDDLEISQSGVLTFASSPDFEAPTGGTANDSNTYQVVVQASDGGVESFVNWFKVTVTVTDVEEPGMVAEWDVDADGDSTSLQTTNKLLQFQPEAILTVANPTDSDGGVANVRWQWYRSSSRSAMGTVIDDANAATYTVSDTSTSNDVGMYLRVVATYSDARGPNKTASYVSENPVQAARDDNTPPVFALSTETRGILENTTGNVGSPLTATDVDGDILTYSIAGVGADNASFTIDRATGHLMVDGLDHEAATDIGDVAGNNTYVVTVTATDSHGEDSAIVTVTITVTDVNENPTFTAGTQGMAADHLEDTLDLAISTYTAIDPEGAVVTLSLMGDDAAKFELNDATPVVAGTKILAFIEKPDFEMPGDQNGDNVYEVTVRASDDTLNADRTVTVKVTDADEAGVVDLSSQDAEIGVELTATLTDSDTGAPNTAQFIDQVWTWHSLPPTAPVTTPADANNAIAGAASAAYTPVVADRGRYLKAMVTYTDRTRDEDNDDNNNTALRFVGFMNDATSRATTLVRNNPSNQAPVFAEGSRTVRLVEENTNALTGTDDDDAAADNPDDNVGGGPVTATDADADSVNYTLSGSDMFRVRVNGQIEVSDRANLDYETSSSHTVTLTADDGSGESNSAATITVTIHVTDLDERPTITDRGDSTAIGEQQVEYVENSTGPVIRLTARDPEGVTPIVWSLLTDDTGVQDLGIFTDIIINENGNAGNDGIDDAEDDVEAVDIADRGLFEISQTGELSFMSPHSYELNSDSGDKNYQVAVQVSDGGTVEHVNWFKVTVTVTDVPEDGAVAEWTIDPDGDATGQAAGQSLLQFNASAILAAGALTDDDGTPMNIQWQWYRSSSRLSIGTEINGETTNTYSVEDTPANPNDVGKYLRVQATYTVGTGPIETASFVSINPVQATRDAANTPPVFSAASVDRRITEDTVDNVGAPLRATDVDSSDILTYSIAGVGADNASFTIDRATGQLMVDGLDHEAATDIGDVAGNNTYVVTVTATDSSGGSATVTVTITVTDVNENPTFTAGTQGMAADHLEDTLDLAISTYTAIDPEGAVVTLSLMGDDAAKFELNDATPVVAGTKILAFIEKPDFEMPGDQNGDNVYEVTVRASDDTLNADRTVTVKVTDADEAGVVDLSSQDAEIGVELTATLTDSDTGAPNTAQFIDQVWTWHSLPPTAPVTTPADANNAIAGAASAAYTPVVADRGRYLKAMVTYTDRTRDEDNDDNNNTALGFVGFMNDATSRATTLVRNNPSNQAPVFAEGSRTVRLVEENTNALTGTDDDDAAADNPDDNVGGGPVTATDADQGQQVAYTLSGSDMFRVRANGQIEVSDRANLDYETSSSHTVILTATDTSSAANNSATIEVSIHVTDLDEAPIITESNLTLDGPGRRDYTENGTEPVGTYTMGGSEAAGATMSLMGDDAGDFMLTGGVLNFRSTPNFEMPMDMGENNEYMVTVMARKGDLMAKVDVTVTVTDMDELGTLSGPVTASHMENSTDAVGTYMVASIPDAANPNWTLMGDDTGSFMLDGTGMSRMLKFLNGPDFEMPMGGSGNDSNTYMVTVKAEAGGEMDEIMVTVTVDNVEEPGTVTLMPTSPVVGSEVTASLTDLDGGITGTTWQWSKSMTMDGTFTDIGTATSASYTPVEDDAGMYLQATATYDDGHGIGKSAMDVTASAVTQVAITDGPSAVEYPENGTNAVGTYTADSTASITWSLSGDDDRAFNISSGGELTFSASPDFEAPADAGMDNVYNVTVVATAGDATDSQEVTVTVSNVDEDGTVTLMPTSPVVGSEVTASLTDLDGGITGTTWQWSKSMTMDGTFTDIGTATSASYTPVEDDAGMYLQATATYTDGHGTGKMASSGPVMVNADTVAGYDSNNDGVISRSELFDAVEDYFNGDLNRSDLFDVIEAYFG